MFPLCPFPQSTQLSSFLQVQGSTAEVMVPSSPASGVLGSRDALKKVASKEHACRAAGLAQGWRGKEMESLQQGPCPH